MNRIAWLPLLGTVACSSTLYWVTGAQSTAIPDVAYACVQAQLKELGYERVRHDTMERWIVARKLDPSVRISSGTFRRAFDVLDARVRPDASGSTGIEIKAQTFHQYELQRGQTDEEQAASRRVKEDAATLAQACSQ